MENNGPIVVCVSEEGFGRLLMKKETTFRRINAEEIKPLLVGKEIVVYCKSLASNVVVSIEEIKNSGDKLVDIEVKSSYCFI